jgi:hypothetical protein
LIAFGFDFEVGRSTAISAHKLELLRRVVWDVPGVLHALVRILPRPTSTGYLGALLSQVIDLGCQNVEADDSTPSIPISDADGGGVFDIVYLSSRKITH